MPRSRFDLSRFLIEDITDRPGLFLLRMAGGVLSWFGVGVLALLVWLVYAWLHDHRQIDPLFFLIFAVLAVIGFFCVKVGLRLFLNRPNAYYSILSPIGRGILGCLFAVFALFLLVQSFKTSTDQIESLRVTVLCALFAIGCLYMALRTARARRC